MKNILKRYWIRDVGRAIFVKQYQVSSSSGLFKFSGSCATQDINREIWCDTRSQVVCWAGSIPRGECECFATWGNVVFWILESGLYLLLPEGKQASKEYQWFQPFCGLPQIALSLSWTSFQTQSIDVRERLKLWDLSTTLYLFFN